MVGYCRGMRVRGASEVVELCMLHANKMYKYKECQPWPNTVKVFKSSSNDESLLLILDLSAIPTKAFGCTFIFT
jgi:hypothetical protein